MKNSLLYTGRAWRWVIFAALVLTACHRGDRKQRLVIGVSYQNLQNEFIINLQDAVRARARALGADLVELDAQGRAETQIAQVENLVAFGADVIILSPCDREGSAPAVDIARREHKPIVLVNGMVANTAKADAFVGSEDTEAGRIAASYIMELLGGKGDIAIIHGPNGHSAEVLRSQGIRDVLRRYPSVHVVAEQTANWDRAQALALMENWLAAGRHIDAVVAQNDEMALGALKAIQAAHREKDIRVVGIDAIPDALRAVAAHQLAGTVFQDARGQGTLAVDVAVRLARHLAVAHDNYIPFRLITPNN